MNHNLQKTKKMRQSFLLLFFSVSVFSQKITESFVSYKLDETRKITIGLPPSYERSPNKKYPILIVLDSNYLFDPFYSALNYGAYWDNMPETVIVGISQIDEEGRANDCNYDESTNLPAGKGAVFFEFIGTELIPYIEKKYRIFPLRIIAGHDKTAGFLNFYLYKDNPAFDAYISISPQLAPEMENQIATNLLRTKRPLFYYQSNAFDDIKEDLESVKILDENIRKGANPLLNYKYEHFKEATHYSVVLNSIPSALYSLFDCYEPISKPEYDEKIVTLKSGFTKYLTDKYALITKMLGLNIQIRLTDFKAIEAAILKNKAYPELELLSKIANKEYPKTMLADYELGLMYENLENFRNAAKFYQKAAQLKEIGDLNQGLMYGKYDEAQSKIIKLK